MAQEVWRIQEMKERKRNEYLPTNKADSAIYNWILNHNRNQYKIDPEAYMNSHKGQQLSMINFPFEEARYSLWWCYYLFIK